VGKGARDFAHADRSKIASLPHPAIHGMMLHQFAIGDVMTITAAHISPLIALIAGILILLIPRLLNYIVAIYLILVGIMGLNGIHHFIR
jgi:hypothetical protein